MRIIPAANPPTLCVAATAAMPIACVTMPQTMNRRRPKRSDKAPATSWVSPQVAG
jgi:hypothetical protein